MPTATTPPADATGICDTHVHVLDPAPVPGACSPAHTMTCSTPPPTANDRSNLFSVQNIAAAGIVAIALYLAGQLAHDLSGVPGPVTMLFLAVLLKLAHGVTPRIQAGSTVVYSFLLTAVAFPMLFAFGLVLTPLERLVEGFAPANLVTIVATVSAMVITGFFTSRLVRIYPVEGAIITSTHSGMGGAGDIAILTASDRLRLMPFAQIATRIGGGITVAAILALGAVWGL